MINTFFFNEHPDTRGHHLRFNTPDSEGWSGILCITTSFGRERDRFREKGSGV